MKKTAALFAGIASSTFLPATVLALFEPITGSLNTKSFLISFLVALPFSIAANVLLGLPTFLLLKKLNLINGWMVSAAGIVLGIFLSVVIQLPGFDIRGLLIFVPLTTVSSLAFWIIWRLASK